MNTEAREERLEALGFKLDVQLFARSAARERRPAGPLDVVRLRVGRVPEHHHRVTDEFVHRSAFGEKCVRQHRKITRRLVHEKVGIG